MTNILVLSVGTRNKIIEYFKAALNGSGKVIATDMQPAAPALYKADRYYIVPRITAPDYIDVVLDICKRENISGVLSLIDPELSLLAANEERFRAVGVTIVGSPYALCERALDKMQMFNWLREHGYHCARSYADIETFYQDLRRGTVSYPVIAKPIRGSASNCVNKVSDSQTLEMIFSHSRDMMIQEYLDGPELGVDCYIDMLSGEAVSIFAKKKLLMRAGETDKSVSFKDEKLFSLIENFIRESGWRGEIDIDVFAVNGQYYISEVNPRFGGGYPHAYECGLDHMKMIVNNLNGIKNIPCIGSYEENVMMMKYSEIMIKRQ